MTLHLHRASRADLLADGLGALLARPLPAEHLAQIQSTLEKATGKKVLLDKAEDPSLLGGVVAKLGDTVYDGSVRSQLERMREQILS